MPELKPSFPSLLSHPYAPLSKVGGVLYVNNVLMTYHKIRIIGTRSLLSKLAHYSQNACSYYSQSTYIYVVLINLHYKTSRAGLSATTLNIHLAAISYGSTSSIVRFIVGDMWIHSRTSTKYWLSLSTDWTMWLQLRLVKLHTNYSASSIGACIHRVPTFVLASTNGAWWYAGNNGCLYSGTPL